MALGNDQSGPSPSVVSSRPRGSGAATVLAGCAVAALGLACVLGQAVRGTTVVNHQRSARVVADARLDDAYYSCLDIQARSLITPSTSVRYRPGASLGEAVILNKVVGSWITLSPARHEPAGFLGLRHADGPGACLGDVVTLRTRGSDGTWIVRIGHGATVPGQGPPPAPPL